MKRGQLLAASTLALALGIATVAYGPAGWVTPLLFLSFAICVLVGWLIIFEHRAFNLAPWHLLLLGPLKATATIKPSGRLQALWLSVAYLTGLFLGIAWVVYA